MSSGSTETIKDFKDVEALLHRDELELVFVVDPNEECLIVIVEDTSS